MKTPIYDFINEYRNSNIARMHMPGHKGASQLGFESFDITEIQGADALYEAEGIIGESEANATALFGTGRTVYSTEGSSQCIKAMLYLAALTNKTGKPPVFIAGRNAHKAFVYAAALLGAEVVWIYPEENEGLCSCKITKKKLQEALAGLPEAPTAVFVTSPDYLGNQADIEGLAEVAHMHDTLLLVDNAHGAYLHFLEPSQHPMDLGADICCDSAHKTLPVLTGGAYLHVSKNAPEELRAAMKQAMEPFGSTSPSYLTLASLDLCNKYLSEDYAKKLYITCRKLTAVKMELMVNGWNAIYTDPLKLTIEVPAGITGAVLAEKLRKAGCEPEFADPDYLVLMFTPENTDRDYEKLVEALGENTYGCGCSCTECYNGHTENVGDSSLHDGIHEVHVCDCTSGHKTKTLKLEAGERVMSLREAVFARQESVSIDAAVDRICASPAVSCPPAIPVVISGERITENAMKIMKKYGIKTINVVEER